MLVEVRLAISILLIAGSFLLAGCEKEGAQPSVEGKRDSTPLDSTSDDSAALFVDVAASVGVDFIYDPGSTGDYYFCEITGAGAGLFDYDSDGDLDLYLTQGHRLPQADAEAGMSDRLFRNDLSLDGSGKPTIRFVDVTEQSGIRATGYGQGVVAGDYDSDGHIDLYLTNFGSNQLWKNDGDGTFTDVTSEAGVDDSRWSTSAAFVDYDRDGHLDLYLANYVDFDLGSHKRCVDPSGYDEYCGPHSYDPVPDRLFRNNGDGTFTDVTAASGIASAFGAGLGVIVVDANRDGWADIYVANDQNENQLWINRSGKSFENTAMISGCALNSDGKAESGMGVDAGDFDGDGDDDIFVTHLAAETNTLYLGDGSGGFDDATRLVSLGLPSWKYTGFGTVWIDYDNDSWLDLFVANGAVTAVTELDRKKYPRPYLQHNLLFRNVDGKRFENVSQAGGRALELFEVSRGTAVGDIDNDGDHDLVVGNLWGPTRILLNQSGADRGWVGLRLRGNGRDQLGARVELELSGGRVLARTARTDGSYISSRDPRILIGLGDATKIERVRVRWPGGTVEDFPPVPVRAWTTLEQGSGKRVP